MILLSQDKQVARYHCNRGIQWVHNKGGGPHVHGMQSASQIFKSNHTIVKNEKPRSFLSKYEVYDKNVFRLAVGTSFSYDKS